MLNNEGLKTILWKWGFAALKFGEGVFIFAFVLKFKSFQTNYNENIPSFWKFINLVILLTK